MPHQQVDVEFYGVPRQRAKQPRVSLTLPHTPFTLADVIGHLSRDFPQLAEDCFRDNSLAAGYLFSVAGEYFVVDADEVIEPGKPLLLMSADAGG